MILGTHPRAEPFIIIIESDFTPVCSICANLCCRNVVFLASKLYDPIMSDNFAAEEDWIMLKTIGVGTEVFHKMIEENKYYVDKTALLRTVFKENGSEVLLITRPRRLGKTLTM